MGAEGKTTIWNHDKIREEARRRGGVVAEYFDTPEGHYAYYVYPNPLGSEPEFLGVAYWDSGKHSINLTPMSFYGTWEDSDFSWKLFKSSYKRKWVGASFGDFDKEELRQVFDFVVWACDNALIANWEVWT